MFFATCLFVSSPLYTTELWVQPTGSILRGIFGEAHVSVGSTVTLTDRWQLVVGAAFTHGALYLGDTSPRAVQWWLSASPVYLFHKPGNGSGFFVGPKLSFSALHSERGGWETCDSNCSVVGWRDVPPATQWGFELGGELGYRLQFDHFALTFLPPVPSIGFAVNNAGGGMSTGYPFTSIPAPGKVGFTYNINLNFIRIGGSF